MDLQEDFNLKISISILVPSELTKTKTESFVKPMQCTKKDHLTDTALPSKSIPCTVVGDITSIEYLEEVFGNKPAICNFGKSL